MTPAIRHSPLLTVMIKAVRKASRGLRRDFGELEQLQVSRKGPADFVTNADIRVEGILQRELKQARPGFGFVMEEGEDIPAEDGEHYWIIDPIDGTNNFLHGIPHFCVSVAVEQRRVGRREAIAGVIYAPAMDELYVAERGQGAYLNDRTRLRVSGRKDLSTCLICMGGMTLPHGRAADTMKLIAAVGAKVSGIRCTGAAALDLAYVAAGRFDGFFHAGLRAWDMAAGMLLIQEAGGQVTDFNGGRSMLETGEILASNAEIARSLASIVQEASI